MKKIMMICIVAAFATSCKKDYVCECTSVDSSSGTAVTTVNTLKATTKKKDAEAWCSAFPKSTIEFLGTKEPIDPMTCKLK